MLISLNILRYGGMRIVTGTLSSIKYLGKEWTGSNIEKQLKLLNRYFLTKKFKKSY